MAHLPHVPIKTHTVMGGNKLFIKAERTDHLTQTLSEKLTKKEKLPKNSEPYKAARLLRSSAADGLCFHPYLGRTHIIAPTFRLDVASKQCESNQKDPYPYSYLSKVLLVE
jgi:hypothetical protein